MKRIAVLNVESSRLAGFTNKGVQVYANDTLTNEEVIVSMTKRPVCNQVALVTSNIIQLFGSPKEYSTWKSILEWSLKMTATQFTRNPDLISDDVPFLEAITIDSDKTFYKSDAISITKDGILFHVYDFSEFKIHKLKLCSDVLVSKKVIRCLDENILKDVNFQKGAIRRALSVNLTTKEVFKSQILITDCYTFNEAGISSDDIAKWGKAFSKIVCSHFHVKETHDVTRPLHSLLGIAIITGQTNLIDKIQSNIHVERTINFISQRIEKFKTAIESPSLEGFINWTYCNPIIQLESHTKSFSYLNNSKSDCESFKMIELKSEDLKIDSIS